MERGIGCMPVIHTPFPSIINSQRAVQRLRLFGMGVGADFPTLKPVAKQQARPPPPPQPAAYAGPKEGRRRRRRSRYEHEGLYEAQHHGHNDELFLASSSRAKPNSSSSSIGGERPSWYLGGGSSAPDLGSIGASPGYAQAAQRYGWRGVEGLHEYHLGRMAAPPRLITPTVLRGGGAAAGEGDTWTPKLPPHSSPAGWPSNGEYVEGYKAKRYSTSYVYNRETTVNDAQQPLPDLRLRRMRQRELEEQREVQAGIQAERRQRVTAAAAAAAAAVGAAIHEARRNDEANGDDDAKWQALEGVHEMLVHYQPLARLRSVELEGLAVCLQLHCFGGQGTTLVTREGFVDAFWGRHGSRLLHEHNIKPDILFSLCRSSSQRRVVCFVEVVALLIVLDEEMDVRGHRGGGLLQEQQPRPGVERTLVRLFRLYQRHRPHCNVTENLNALFLTCSRNAHEGAEMAALLHREFLPYCYRMAALKTLSSPAGAASPSSSPLSSSSTAPPAGARGAAAVRFRVRTPSAVAAAMAVGGAGRRTEGGEPLLVYDICNGVFREQDFERALAVNPRVVRLFQEQMTRAQACAIGGAGGGGKRGRTSPIGAEEEEGETEEQKQEGEGKERTRKKKDVGSILANLFPRKEKKSM